VRFARAAPGLEGAPIDFRARGSTVELEGSEGLDGRKAYRIGVTLATGEHQLVWVDAESDPETRYDRIAYGSEGTRGTITPRYKEYQEVEGLAMPSVIEIGGAGGGRPDRRVIERVALNPEIDEREFDGLGGPRARASAVPRATPR
jgi:hypothetical protein